MHIQDAIRKKNVREINRLKPSIIHDLIDKPHTVKVEYLVYRGGFGREAVSRFLSLIISIIAVLLSCDDSFKYKCIIFHIHLKVFGMSKR
ncbi:hypothetical protein AZ468_03290 [Vibrio europaeus]|uniref:Uncharacterized protein n=1 Tax=Vibrio europaeus TaxID=300876 RepID=A0A178JDA7_9VIBR|nr:hypothetical protein AZ468_03290 [Vibrio europaeus]